ncbi:MAG: hypothetical protein ABW156_01240 [Jiangellaceae bacterium]
MPCSPFRLARDRSSPTCGGSREPLRRAVPFRAAWISLLDPELRAQPPLISQGFPDGLREYLSSPDGVAEIDLLALTRPGTVTRASCERS